MHTLLNGPRGPRTRLLFGLLLATVLLENLSATITWEPIPAEQRTAQPPASAPDAVAEVLYSRIDLTVKSYKATQRNLLRVKVYSERAVEELGKLGVDYAETEQVSGLGARVVH